MNSPFLPVPHWQIIKFHADEPEWHRRTDLKQKRPGPYINRQSLDENIAVAVKRDRTCALPDRFIVTLNLKRKAAGTLFADVRFDLEDTFVPAYRLLVCKVGCQYEISRMIRAVVFVAAMQGVGVAARIGAYIDGEANI